MRELGVKVSVKKMGSCCIVTSKREEEKEKEKEKKSHKRTREFL